MRRSCYKRWLLLALAGSGLLAAVFELSPRISAAASQRLAGEAKPPVIRLVRNPEAAPPLDAHDLFGQPVNKDTWAGKVILVNFWATWCPPCRMEIPELLELKREFGDRLEIIGISEDEDGPENVMHFVLQKKMIYPVVMATAKLVDSYGGVAALPTTFVIDTQGRVVQKHSGLHPIDTYQQEIRALLGLHTDAQIETFEDTGQVFLKNAANATELPGVSFQGLTAEQKKKALRRMNSENCTCGCELTISQCRVNDTGCPTSLKIAADIVKEAAEGEKPARTPSTKDTTAITQ